jgi:arylsulfatase A-like enzyme
MGEPRSRLAPPGALLDMAAIVAAWAVALLVEDIAVKVLWRGEFSAAWETAQARRLVPPVALAGLAPASIVVAGWWRVAQHARAGSRLARGALAALGTAAGAVLALGVSTGRHFASWGARAPFVAGLAVVGGLAGALVAPRVAALGRRAVALAALGVATALGAWLADAFVLPRLYPAFHATACVTVLLGAALAGLAARAGSEYERPGRGAWLAVAAAALLVGACAAWTPRAVRAMGRLSNLRIVLVEHAPLLGRTVQAVELLRPPEAAVRAPDTSVPAPGEVERSLDWTGRDIVLVSIDALRADHVSAYGGPRPTTPNIDALAGEGTLFEAAYCPTPHTSYSVTSMMSGKYLRPLLALGLGEDSETWALDLRRYGWRTAAFYPPAVFFIDEDRFRRFEDERLGFEYAKVEFADPALRERQVAEYLDGAPATAPLFLWVHFFEPHEPYVAHPDHAFTGGRSAAEDAYDGEVATADDGVGRIVRLVRARRPGAVVVVTADHGEEFGEHGGRYHGTTVYEEQVRVPLVVAGPGVRRAGRVTTVVQTVDLLPTALSALGIPRPARLRGRDLGPLLAGKGGAAAPDPGFAFAETDDYALVASGADRLVCERRAAACALYRPADDPLEKRDRSGEDPARFEALRGMLRAVERDHGRYEAAGGPAWPEALRRGMVGDADAARDVASLLDDADVAIRRKAAEVSYALHAAEAASQVRRAFERDEDEEVRRWSALALVRMGEPVPPVARALLEDGGAPRAWQRRAALALGERGEAHACDELAAWWTDVVPPQGTASPDGEPPRLRIELAAAQELLAATKRARCRAAAPALVRALADVRARPFVADALGALGDDRARAPLLALLVAEPYVTTRPHEARALLALGARDWAAPSGPAAEVRVPSLRVPRGAARLLVLLSDATAGLEGSLGGVPLLAAPEEGEVRAFVVGPVRGPTARLELRASAGGVVAAWLVP